MKKIYFKCKFKTDIILNSKTSTEGKNSPLDYIPGNIFLGIVAKNYKQYKDNAFDIFHSGKIRFNDATLLINGKESFKIPFSYFTPKGVNIKNLLSEKTTNDKKIFVHHHLDKDRINKLKEKGIQLKQVRSGYFNKDGNFLNIESTYSQKSAYDKDKRRSKDSQMFGFNAIKRGTEFLFSVEFDDNIDKELKDKVVNNLIGDKFIGKSKTAQYGKVKIEKLDNYNEDSIENLDKHSELVIYAKSNLAFIDEKTGMPTAQPTFENCKILWDKSQIRIRRYTPYNGARKTHDYERVIIEKGSVFILRPSNNFDFDNFKKVVKNGIGIYKSEGFGKVLINPTFLMELNPKFQFDENFKNSKEIEGFDGNKDKDLINWLEFKQKEKEKIYKLLDNVNNLINNNFNILKTPSLSQWGQVRSICLSHIIIDKINKLDKNGKSIYDKLFNDKFQREEDKGFCVHGTSKEQWENLISILKNKDSKFLELLSIEVMRKIKTSKKEKNNE